MNDKKVKVEIEVEYLYYLKDQLDTLKDIIMDQKNTIQRLEQELNKFNNDKA